MQDPAKDFVPITIEEFLFCRVTPADVFIRLGSENYILFAREGTKDQFTPEGLEEKAKAGAQFFVHRQDYRKFAGAQVSITNEVFKSDKFSIQNKTHFLSRTVISVFNSIQHLGFNHEVFGQAKFVASSVLQMVDAQPRLNSLIEVLSGVSDEIVQHSVAVSAVSVMIAHNKGWNNPVLMEKLALGALLHDIGLKEYSKEFLSKPRSEYTAEDLALYEKHCFRGVEILRTVPSIPQEVMAIAFEHHENAIGQGFPRGLRDVRMHPFAKIVALADTFAELTLKSVNNPEPRTSEQALDFIEHSLGQPFNKELFAGLKSVLYSGLKKVSVKIVA